MAVLIYPSVVCVRPCRLLGAQCHSLWPNGRENLPSTCPPDPTTPPTTTPPTYPLIYDTRDITRVVKTISNASIEYSTAELAMKH